LQKLIPSLGVPFAQILRLASSDCHLEICSELVLYDVGLSFAVIFHLLYPHSVFGREKQNGWRSANAIKRIKTQKSAWTHDCKTALINAQKTAKYHNTVVTVTKVSRIFGYMVVIIYRVTASRKPLANAK
jgi:hypothetical protein